MRTAHVRPIHSPSPARYIALAAGLFLMVQVAAPIATDFLYATFRTAGGC